MHSLFIISYKIIMEITSKKLSTSKLWKVEFILFVMVSIQIYVGQWKIIKMDWIEMVTFYARYL